MRWWLALLVGVYLVSAWPTRLTMVDDAYVSLRYAHQLAVGSGLTYNAGQAPVEGYTDFAWVLLMAPGTLLPIHPSSWATTWGLVFGATSVAAMAGLASRFVEGRWAILPAAVLATSPQLAVASTNGLETSMFLAAVLAAAWAATAETTVAAAATDQRSRWLSPSAWAGPLAASLYLVRPEGLVVGLIFAVLAGKRALIWVTAIDGAYFLWRWHHFGTLLPNTFHAQARAPFFEMWETNAAYFGRCPELWIGVGVLALIAGATRNRRSWVLLAAASMLALVALRVYNWMPGARLFLPSIALVLAAAAPALVISRRLMLALVAWAAWLAVGPPRFAETKYDRDNSVLPDNGGERLGRAIARLASPGVWLLARDAGVVPYFAGPNVNVIDIHDYSVTEPRLTGKPFDVDWVLGHDSPFLVTTIIDSSDFPSAYTNERLLLQDPRVRNRFRSVATMEQHHRRVYVLWVRDDVLWP